MQSPLMFLATLALSSAQVSSQVVDVARTAAFGSTEERELASGKLAATKGVLVWSCKIGRAGAVRYY